jgi:hypothetical protein
MLRPDQVKPFIDHPERVVRNFAVQYFYESYNQDADLLPLVLQVIEAEEYWDPSIDMRLSWAKRFTQTRETVAEVFRRMKDDDDLADWYEELLSEADPELIAAFPDELANLTPPTLKKFERRRKISSLSTPELWTEFQRYVAEYMPEEECEPDDEYGTWLIRELAKRPDLPMDEINERMNIPLPEKIDGYAESFLCELLGELRMSEALPFFIQCLQNEDELLNDTASTALIQLGTFEVVQALEPLYPSGTSGLRINTAWVLMNIKLPAAEEALIRLLRDETDMTDATLLASSLCKLLSVKAVPLIRELLHHGYDRKMLCLEEELYVNCLMNGKDLPEMSEWRMLVARNFEKNDNWDFDNCEDDDDDDDYEDDTEDGEDAEEEWSDEGEEWTDDMEDEEFEVKQRTVVRIGRNDSCPCGSGKKYKKCCLGRQGQD